MSYPVPYDEGPYQEDDGYFQCLESRERWYQEREDVRRLVRMAYEGQPEQAGKEAKAMGLYLEMITHMMKVHKRLTMKYSRFRRFA